MVERCVRDAEAAGSNPVTSTSQEPRHAIRVVEVLLFYSLCLAFKVGFEHSHHSINYRLYVGRFYLIHLTYIMCN